MSKVIFVLRSSAPAGFKFQLESTGELANFVNKRLETDDEAIIKEIRGFMRKPGAISRFVREVNKTAAEALVQQHLASKPRNAIPGGVTAEAARQAELQAQKAAEIDLNEAARKALEADGLVVTETTDVVPPVVEEAPEKSPAPETSGIKLGASK